MKFRTKEVFRKIIKLDKIPVNSQHFDFDMVNYHEWATLLSEDKANIEEYKLYLNKYPKKKSDIISHYPHSSDILKAIRIEKEEMKYIDKSVYKSLLISDFKTYFDKELFKKLGKMAKSDIFAERPIDVYKTLGEIPPLTRYTLQRISDNNPKFIIDHFDELKDQLKTNDTFWFNMIKKDKKFKELFIQYTHTLDTKTSLRTVIKAYPTLIKHLTVDIMENSILTKKEWVLLVTDILNRKDNSVKITKEFGDWKIPEDLFEEIKLGLSVEILSGKSKLSKRLTNSLSKIEEDAENNEDISEVENSIEEQETKTEI